MTEPTDDTPDWMKPALLGKGVPVASEAIQLTPEEYAKLERGADRK